MKLKWLGHASFLITAERSNLQGRRVITDPYAPMGEQLRYAPIEAEAEFVTVSHEHGDHNNVEAIKGNPTVIRGLEILGSNQTVSTIIDDLLPVRIVAAHHDADQGSQRGQNAIICFDVDGMWVCHLGDLGHPLSDEAAAAIHPVDILLVPVGGEFTIDAAVATQTAQQLRPKAIVPMHYRNEKCQFPIASVDAFLEGRKNVRKVEGSEVQMWRNTIPQPENAETIVLQSAN